MRRRLTGARARVFAFTGSNWFARPGGRAAEWTADLQLLGDEHRQLRDAVAQLSEADICAPLGGTRQPRAG